MSSKSGITFYGGVHEIGGNKFLIEDKGTKIFLDFGMQMGKGNQYFAEFVILGYVMEWVIFEF